MIRTRQMGRQLEVISCVEVLEEIVGTVDKRPEKSEQLQALHGELINDRLLLQMKARHLCELERGRMLARSERYGPPAVRARMEAGVRSGTLRSLISAGRGVHREDS